ncbi:hypothetical protein ASPCAL02377 [Aspergillus calidoustus]|uniref:FAD dependent oxidoreductase domain-containing protein n=1 Tax=Aspergillus calidoustus TaxID=454130 RepID=A0A0U5GPM0_ASPCI|nr:hypothetical protein ASPCAL02377 [Aspergillus calidoustus]
MTERFDVVIVGAGISTGINAVYRLQAALPDLSYTILEAVTHWEGGTSPENWSRWGRNKQ